MRVRLSAPVLALLVSVAATTAAQSGRFDYPQWRGLHRDGGPTGHLWKPVLRQGRGHADSLDDDGACSLTA